MQQPRDRASQVRCNARLFSVAAPLFVVGEEAASRTKALHPHTGLDTLEGLTPWAIAGFTHGGQPGRGGTHSGTAKLQERRGRKQAAQQFAWFAAPNPTIVCFLGLGTACTRSKPSLVCSVRSSHTSFDGGPSGLGLWKRSTMKCASLLCVFLCAGAWS